MFTIPNKLRTIVALGAVGAALAGSGAASAGVASAATINPNKVGSASDDYSNAECASLATAHNINEQAGEQALEGINSEDAEADFGAAADEQSELENNCLVID